jgi:selenocysteine lyase/cysteine desulfurase
MLFDDRVAGWRAETPGCANRNHLNNAGAGLMPQSVLQAMLGHLRQEADIGGYESADAAAGAIHQAYENVARLIGTQARNIAIVENATVAFSQALAAFDFSPVDAIVTTRNDYISNQLMYLSLSRRFGVKIYRARDLPAGGVDPESVRELIAKPEVRLVAVTWVPTNSGLIQPVEAVGKICEAAGMPYLVDACQAVGHIPIDVANLHCDFLSTTARKFLRGPRGIGFLYVSNRALERGLYPLLVDMQGAKWVDADSFELVDDARRFENWEFAYALVLGMGEAARYAAAVGIDEGGRRARELAAYARARLSEVPGLRVLDRGASLAAIVTVEVKGHNAKDVVETLRQRGINTSATLRDYAVIDMDEKRAVSALRLSPHYYNSQAEVDAAVLALAEIVGK